MDYFKAKVYTRWAHGLVWSLQYQNRAKADIGCPLRKRRGLVGLPPLEGIVSPGLPQGSHTVKIGCEERLSLRMGQEQVCVLIQLYKAQTFIRLDHGALGSRSRSSLAQSPAAKETLRVQQPPPATSKAGQPDEAQSAREQRVRPSASALWSTSSAARRTGWTFIRNS